MGISFKHFFDTVPYVVGGGKDIYPVMIRGRHGIGKSEVVYQIARGEISIGIPSPGEVVHVSPKKGKKTQGDTVADFFKVVERRTSQMTEGDLMGLPKVGEGVTEWNPPDWFKECCNHARVLFLDELDRAPDEVRQGVFELGDSRKLNGWTLHPETLIFAATNSGLHGQAGDYQTQQLDPAELDRWWVVDVEPTHDDWLEWANKKILPIIWDFHNEHRGEDCHLDHLGDFLPDHKYPSRRSWVRFSRALEKIVGGLSNKGWINTLQNFDKGTLTILGQGFVGEEAATAFVQYVTSYRNTVSLDDILVHGKIARTASWSVTEHNAFVNKMRAEEIFNNYIPDEKLKNLYAYMITLPSEIAAALHTNIVNSQQKGMYRQQEMIDSNALRLRVLDTNNFILSLYSSGDVKIGLDETSENDGEENEEGNDDSEE